MKYHELEKFTKEHSNQSPTIQDYYVMSVGLAGEVGEVLELQKKAMRDLGRGLDKTDLTHELGDVMWYWTRICQYHEINPEDCFEAIKEKVLERSAKGKFV